MVQFSGRIACALFISSIWTLWAQPAQASCAEGRPEQRTSCAYLSMTTTVTNEAAKADSLMISEIPALARRLTGKCLDMEKRKERAPAQCWQSAAEDARRFTMGVSGAAAGELKRLEAVWTELAQRLHSEQETAAASNQKAAGIEPVSESWRPTNFSPKTQHGKAKRKRKTAAAKRASRNVVKRSTSAAVAKKPVEQTKSRVSARVRKARLNGSLGRRQHGLAWRKRININKAQPKQRMPVAATPGLTCVFTSKSCKR